MRECLDRRMVCGCWDRGGKRSRRSGNYDTDRPPRTEQTSYMMKKASNN